MDRQIKKVFSGVLSGDEFDIYQRVSSLITCVDAAVMFIAGIMLLAIKAPMPGIIAVFASVLITVIGLLTTIYKGKYKFSVFIYALLVNGICLPVQFFYLGGLSGPIIAWFIMGLIVVCIYAGRLMTTAFFALNSVIFGVCIIIGDIYPELIHGVDLLNSPIASAYSFLAVAICIAITIQYQIKLYEKNYTNLLKKDEELQKSEYTTKTIARSKDSFMKTLSHELLTDINNIMGMNELILRDAKDPDVREKSMSIKTSSEMLTKVLNNIVDLANLNISEAAIRNQEFSLSALIKDVYDFTLNKMTSKRVELLVTCNPDIPDSLVGDAGRISQVMVNLLSNSVKFTKEGFIEIYLDFYREEFAEGKIDLIIGIKDTGIGMTVELQEILFDADKRFSPERENMEGGFGLGLLISNDVLHKMGGSIHVQSAKGIGSVFEIELPIQVADEEKKIGKLSELMGEKKKSIYHYEVSFRAPEAKILVVDDNQTNIEVVKGLLEPTEMEITGVNSAERALERIVSEKYDLILMDHLMPGMDGVEAVKKMQNIEHLNKETPIVVLTANAHADSRKYYIREGFTDYISKPVSSAVLEGTVKKYIPVEKLIIKKETLAKSEELKEGLVSEALEKIHFLDKDAALELLGNSEDLYLVTIKAYLEDFDLDGLEASYENHDAALYCTKLHGIKSTSRSIGAMEVSALAEKLESAVKAEDFDYVEEHHRELMEKYRDLGEKLREIV